MQTLHIFDLYLTSVFRNQLKFVWAVVPIKSLQGQKFEMNIFNVNKSEGEPSRHIYMLQ